MYDAKTGVPCQALERSSYYLGLTIVSNHCYTKTVFE